MLNLKHLNVSRGTFLKSDVEGMAVFRLLSVLLQ